LIEDSIYITLYDKYKTIFNEDAHKAQELNLTFDMPLPQQWDKHSIKLRAFLDRDYDFYIDNLAPFEYLLKNHFEKNYSEDYISTNKEYEEFINIYRDEYFKYQQRYPISTYFLALDIELENYDYTSQSHLYTLAKEYMFEYDNSLFEHLRSFFQNKVDAHKQDNLDIQNSLTQKLTEKALLNNYKESHSKLSLYINKHSRDIANLLKEYKKIELKLEYAPLKNYFQDIYDFGDEADLVNYLQTLELPPNNATIKNDISRIRAVIQNKISLNNKEAELASVNLSSQELGVTLLKHASLEQDIITHYRSLISRYYTFLGIEGDFLLINEPFELYFDNYFADFEQKLEYYKIFYKEKDSPFLQTPYYNKMLNSTGAKISVINLNTLQEIEDIKRAYIDKREYLTDLTRIKREYQHEIEILFDEFFRYGELYLKELNADTTQIQQHSQNLLELKKRYDLREKNEFF